MIRTLSLLPVLTLLACGPADTPAAAAADPAQTSAPAPGTQPQPIVSGDVSYRLLAATDFREVEGCTVYLRPENAPEGTYAYGFNYAEGPAEGVFDGNRQILEIVSEDNDSDDRPATYVHANDSYEVTTTVTLENQVDNELWEVSGTVVIRNKRNGKTVRMKVLGEQGC